MKLAETKIKMNQYFFFSFFFSTLWLFLSGVMLKCLSASLWKACNVGKGVMT